MIPRGKLSIATRDLFSALFDSFPHQRLKNLEPNAYFGDALFCLSARTALDLILTALRLPAGTEVIVSNINIPDIFTIIEAHRLKLIPVSINKNSLAVSAQEVADKITAHTRIVLITHLFGAIGEMEGIIELAERHRLMVIEDCAQAFDFRYKGHPKSTFAIFSFGLIKTNTCLTGGMAIVNESKLFHKIKRLNEKLPVQSTAKYNSKIIKAFLIKLVTTKWMYTLLYELVKLLNKDWDEMLSGLTKGFPGDHVRKKIAFRPCSSNLRLLKKRTDNFNYQPITERKKVGELLTTFIPEKMKIGKINFSNTFWVLPLESKNPDQTIAELRRLGIDATSKASSLVKFRHIDPINTDELELTNLVYLPVDRLVLDPLARLKAISLD